MKLTEEQQALLRAWAAEGATLGAIQKRLKSECGITLTYLETRLLVADLGIELDEWKPKPKAPAAAEEETTPEPEAGMAGQEPPANGGVSVTVDKLTRLGAMVSGKVSFSDGTKTSWYVDQQGRLGIEPPVPGYRPPTNDLPAFQAALDRELRKLGL